MKHAALLDLRITHPYYRDGRCPDFEIEAAAETARLLRNHRCSVDPGPSGIRVVTALDAQSGQPLLPLPSAAVLRFYLRLQNSDFALFTDLTAVQQAQAGPLFTNAGMSPGAAGDLTLTGGAARPPGLFAAVDIHPGGHGVGASAPVFNVAFLARELRWAYYFITDLPQSGDPLSIVDASPAGTPGVLLFSEQNRTELTTDPDPSDPVAVQLTGRYQGMRCVRMRSDQAVACREEPRKFLDLMRGADRLSGPLPNPSFRSLSSLSSQSSPQEFLFRIIKFRA